jgi:hypothetical protein
MAAGELPMVRTVVEFQEVAGSEEKLRVLQAEEYHETSLTALGKALEMAGRALGVFKDKTELSGPDGTAAIQVLFVPPGQAISGAPGRAGGQGGDSNILGQG